VGFVALRLVCGHNAKHRTAQRSGYMSKQNTATKILAAIIGTPAIADKAKIDPVGYASAEEFKKAIEFGSGWIANVAHDSATTHSGSIFITFRDGSVLAHWDWRMASGAFGSLEKAIEWVGGGEYNDPRRLYSDFGVFA
jgi:hypothetical protein